MTNKVVFVGREAIMEAYGLTIHEFRHFVTLGMPVRYMFNRRYYGHKVNIDEFFRHITLVPEVNTEDLEGVDH